MRALLLEPHQDDAVLFACFTLLREKPHVVTVLNSYVQESRGTGITASMRVKENEMALVGVLGLTWEQWEHRDDAPDWDAIRADLVRLEAREPSPHVYAPYPEEGGHEHHNVIGDLARAVFGENRVTYYVTYDRWRGRNADGRGKVIPPAELEHIRLKLLALACYQSQIREPSTGHHFAAALDEWYA